MAWSQFWQEERVIILMNKKIRGRGKWLYRIGILCFMLILLLGVYRIFFMPRAGRADMISVNNQVQIFQITGIIKASDLAAGTVIDEDTLDFEHLSAYFVIREIGADIFQYINGKSYVENPDISLEELRYIKLLHYNFDHKIQVGELIVNADIAEDVSHIFQELFWQEYEIQSVYLIDHYWTGDGVSTDTRSIAQNNTSAFNYRVVPGTNRLSNHAMGYAIDINPLQNPYVTYNEDGSFRTYYQDMEKYLDRSSGLPHLITREDICYQIFTKYGFTWGGDWSGEKDYQHFQKK